ncbi:hypothetical protein PM3016_6706 [Paenibacillus mucilaginosus 3016]|uniref:HNH nuclease domain-containing protein n=1 Tax=Paenibacillus mucilaginosus 3016 TaxID=1116391 RepID=H6NNJ3_9BACL|nr:HNH endonuclease signature motif containing protein [Paenibacillus mucilaginosus]AFC33314.1 hypothetical protein PM3016_6706 [Paenibacillus mucilaginosus 3016]WFA21732.1 HNH endonuclease [Paenibacillus mucilaginosus]
MDMIVNPNDPIVRYAILEAHGFFCYYSEERLSSFTMTIDHIIPQSYKGKEEELREYKEKLGPIELNHLYNLVPATWRINLLKGDGLYKLKWAILLRAKAVEKAPNILKRIEQLRKMKHYEKHLAFITSFIANSDSPRQEFAKIAELVTNQFGPFEEKREVTKEAFLRSEQSVRLYGMLPKLYEHRGSCCLEFRSLFVSDCMITFNHETLTELLFNGLDTDFKQGKRSFVVGPHTNIPNLYYVQLGNNRFTLNENEVEELCRIIDDFAEVYLNTFRSIEEHWATLQFRYFLPQNYSVKMIRLHKELWNQMIDFSWEFDYSNGDTNWHIFNKGTDRVMVYQDHKILTELELHIGQLESDDTVWIVWRRHDNRFMSNEEGWNAEQTYTWLTQKFLLYVVYYYEYIKPKKWLERVPTFEKYSESFNLNNYIYESGYQRKQDFRQIQTVGELVQSLYDMQSFYHLSPSVSFSPKEIENIYRGLKYLLLTVELPEYSYQYIGRKMPGIDGLDCTLAGLLQYINLNIEAIEKAGRSTGSVELLFRCFIEVLKGNKAEHAINKAVVHEITSLLYTIWEKYDRIQYINRIGGYK